MFKQIQYLNVIAPLFFNKNLYCCFCFWVLQFYFNPPTPVQATSDVITFDQNWHHLYSNSAGGKDLSNNTQIRVLSLMAPEICTKSWVKTWSKFPAITHGYSMVKFAHLDDAFFEVFLTASKPIRRSITAAKRKKKGKRKSEKKLKKHKSLTWKDVGHFLVSKFWFLCLPAPEPKCPKTRC